MANDPLEGIQIRIVKRPKTAAIAAKAVAAAKVEPPGRGTKTPSFGRYREAEAAPVNGTAKELRGAPKSATQPKPAAGSGKSERGTRSTQRS